MKAHSLVIVSIQGIYSRRRFTALDNYHQELHKKYATEPSGVEHTNFLRSKMIRGVVQVDNLKHNSKPLLWLESKRRMFYIAFSLNITVTNTYNYLYQSCV